MTQLIVQLVMLQWGKKSRGGEGACKRSAIPRAFQLPQNLPAKQFVFHRLYFSEWESFQPIEQIRDSEDLSKLNLADLEATADEDSVSLVFVRDGYNAARPKPQSTAEIFTLLPGEWGRLIYNGRYTDRDTGDWWYGQYTYNIGWFDEIDRDIFRQSEPSHEFSELVHLW